MSRRSFGREFKLEAVRLVSERGLIVAQVARDLDLHENVLRKWVRQYRDDPAHAFPDPGTLEPASETEAYPPADSGFGALWRCGNKMKNTRPNH